MPIQIGVMPKSGNIRMDEWALDCPRCGPNNAPYLHLERSLAWGSESISLIYRCELCGEVSSLDLEQHKGQTLVHWTLD
jgi:uncharacterized Zn finger protein